MKFLNLYGSSLVTRLIIIRDIFLLLDDSYLFIKRIQFIFLCNKEFISFFYLGVSIFGAPKAQLLQAS